jgi:hypothetical protein
MLALLDQDELVDVSDEEALIAREASAKLKPLAEKPNFNSPVDVIGTLPPHLVAAAWPFWSSFPEYQLQAAIGSELEPFLENT